MSLPRLTVLPPLSPRVYLRRPWREPPFPFDTDACRVFALARHGLVHGLRSLGLQPGDEVLVPAFHHGSEIEAMIRADLVPRFYDVDGVLGPLDPEHLIGPRTRALHLVHTLGFPQDAQAWSAWCRERGLLLIEDAAQAWLATIRNRPAGSFGDLAIFSLYKTVGVPDGGAVAAATPLPAPGRGPMGAGRVARRHAAWLASRSGLVARFGGRTDGSGYAAAEDFALGDPGSGPIRATPWLLPRAHDPSIPGRRRENFRILDDLLPGRMPLELSELSAGASPFAFPVRPSDKSRLLAHLAERRIEGLDLWGVAHPALPPGMTNAARLREQIVTVPVHQELRPSDLQRIADAVRVGDP